MLEAFAKALNGFGLELDAPQTGHPIHPNEPGAKITIFCENCQYGGGTTTFGGSRTTNLSIHPGKILEMARKVVGTRWNLEIIYSRKMQTGMGVFNTEKRSCWIGVQP